MTKLATIAKHRREQIEREHPGAISLKTWRFMQAEREQVVENTIVKRYYRGRYPKLKTKTLNARVVLVLNP